MLTNWATRITFIVLSLIYCNTYATSNIFKWTDKDGQTHYGEEPNNKSSTKIKTIKSKHNSNNSLVTKKRLTVEKIEENGVTRYFLLTNERINKFSQKPTTLEINNDKLWLTFQHSILSFDLVNHQSDKYDLKKLEDHISTQNMHFTDELFIFLEKAKKSSDSFFHVYNHKTQEYRKWPTDNNLYRIINYENNDDILITGNTDSTLSLFKNINNFDELASKNANKHIIDSAGSLTINADVIWHTYWIKPNGKENCSVGYFFRNKSSSATFNHKEIGFPKSNTCGWIISDNEEVWVTSRSRENGSVFAVYNINNNNWESLAVSKNGFPMNQSPIQLDSNNLYYNSCENIIALNRKSRNASVIDTDIFNDDDKHKYCIYNFKLHKNNLWILKFEPYKYKITPVLYRIPVNMFDKEILEYHIK